VIERQTKREELGWEGKRWEREEERVMRDLSPERDRESGKNRGKKMRQRNRERGLIIKEERED
jgi:hypothetical protein